MIRKGTVKSSKKSKRIVAPTIRMQEMMLGTCFFIILPLKELINFNNYITIKRKKIDFEEYCNNLFKFS